MPFQPTHPAGDAGRPTLKTTAVAGIEDYLRTFRFWEWSFVEAMIVVGIVATLTFLGAAARESTLKATMYQHRVDGLTTVLDRLPQAGGSARMSQAFQTCVRAALAHRSPVNPDLPTIDRIRSSDDLMRLAWRPCAFDALDQVRQHDGEAAQRQDQAVLDAAQARALNAWNAVSVAH